MQNSKRILSIILLGIGFHFLAACGENKKTVSDDEPAAPSSGPVLSWPATRSTAKGSYEVTLTPSNGEIMQNKHFTLDVTLKAKKGGLENVTVVVDGDMPAHQHGMNTKPELTARSASESRVEGMLFHMGGDWVITVDITRDGKKEQALFPISVE